LELRRSVMTLRGFMNTPPPAVRGDATVMDAVRLMGRDKVGAVLVEEDRKLRGIFTYRDLIDRVLLAGRNPETTTVGQVMTEAVESIGKEGSYADALRAMIERDYTYLPVVDAELRVLGMVSLRGLLEHRADELTDRMDSLAKYFAVDAMGGD